MKHDVSTIKRPRLILFDVGGVFLSAGRLLVRDEIFPTNKTNRGLAVVAGDLAAIRPFPRHSADFRDDVSANGRNAKLDDSARRGEIVRAQSQQIVLGLGSFQCRHFSTPFIMSLNKISQKLVNYLKMNSSLENSVTERRKRTYEENQHTRMTFSRNDILLGRPEISSEVLIPRA